MLDIISDPSAGTPADKLRLFLIYYILSPEVTDSDLSQFTAALESVGADMTPLAYIKRWRYVLYIVMCSCMYIYNVMYMYMHVYMYMYVCTIYNCIISNYVVLSMCSILCMNMVVCCTEFSKSTRGQTKMGKSILLLYVV